MRRMHELVTYRRQISIAHAWTPHHNLRFPQFGQFRISTNILRQSHLQIRTAHDTSLQSSEQTLQSPHVDGTFSSPNSNTKPALVQVVVGPNIQIEAKRAARSPLPGVNLENQLTELKSAGWVQWTTVPLRPFDSFWDVIGIHYNLWHRSDSQRQ